MKTNKLYKSVLALFAFIGVCGFTSCEDFLTVEPTDQITEEQFWKSKSDVDNSRAGIYNQMTTGGVTQKILQWGEVRCDNFIINDNTQTMYRLMQEATLQPTDNIYDWSSLYKGINLCNLLLVRGQQMIDNDVDPSFSNGDWKPIKAEAIGMRALYYFYLVKAFRNVPYTTTAYTTDAEARKANLPATKGVVILDSLINQLEECRTYAATNYGSSSENKGRLTKRSIKAILADMYLWRGCMLNKSDAKGDSIADANAKRDLCFSRANELCDSIILEMNQEYRQNMSSGSSWGSTSSNQDANYPLIPFYAFGSNVTDNIYTSIWANENSSESIFELQYDGTNNQNSALTIMSSFSNGVFSAKILSINPSFMANTSSVDPEKGYGKTDIRMLEVCNLPTGNSTSYPFHRGIAQSISIQDLQDMTKGFGSTPQYTPDNGNASNWPVYRLSDIMLMKAEALARKATLKDADYETAYNLVLSLFKRYNPQLLPAEGNDGETLISTRLNPDYWSQSENKNATKLLTTIYAERQREFIGEGKRWFDLVRQSEYENSTNTALATFMGATKTIQNRLRNLVSLYNPIYSEELKVNDNLKQNIIWEKYSKN